ncbi:SphA family protein [Rhodoblastus sp.]|uniref:SphA family protein n=1 Tax=Rhodoblastus sp. TaxID=1962975 RepID=UPI003F961734
MPLDPAVAEEGGSGHYLPGSIASFIDAAPLDETFIVRFNGLNYLGSASAERPIPFAGVAAAGAKADVWGAGLTLLWRPPIDLGGKWSYAMSMTIPYLSSDISANAVASLGNGLSGSIARERMVDAIGDIIVMPLMLNYNFNRDFNANFRVGIYTPTGSYQLGSLSNTGKNFWTFEPVLGFVYFGQQNGIEVSVYPGVDFNTENPATHYQSGTQFHIDGTLAQHFPLLGGLAGLGVSAYDYSQVTPDSGTGATLGPFEGKSVGVGPVASYIVKIAGHDTIWEAKWLHETDTQNRLQGNIYWLKIVSKF